MSTKKIAVLSVIAFVCLLSIVIIACLVTGLPLADILKPRIVPTAPMLPMLPIFFTFR